MPKVSIKQGDIALAPFPFTDLSSAKVRPVLVMHKNLDDVVVVFITSKNKSKEGIGVDKDQLDGLKEDSIILYSKIATLDQKILIGKIGNLEKARLKMVSKEIRQIFEVE